MLALFYQYLIRHQKIVLPGLGTVALDRQPAVSDFVDREFLPPSYSFQWTQANANPPDNFFSWMAHRLEIAEEDAVIRINNFIADVKREINAGKEILWSGVGVIRRGLDSSIELEPEQKVLTFDKKVYGDKVVHEDSSHIIIVGDKEKTSQEMSEILSHPLVRKMQKIQWLKVALIAAVLLLVFMLAYFWKYGIHPGSVANQKKLAPNEAPATYQPVK